MGTAEDQTLADLQLASPEGKKLSNEKQLVNMCEEQLTLEKARRTHGSAGEKDGGSSSLKETTRTLCSLLTQATRDNLSPQQRKHSHRLWHRE